MSARTDALAEDRAAWEAWCAAELSKLDTAGPVGSGINAWDDNRIHRAMVAGKRIPGFVDSPQGPYAGPWHIVKHWASEEFREYVEREGHPRFTWKEWRERAAAEREALEEDERAYSEDVARPLERLEDWRALHDARGQIIADARERGATWADITAASGLSRMQAWTLATDYAAAAARSASLATVGVDDDEPF